MPPEELQQHIARIKEQERAEAEKMHDTMLSRQRLDETINKNKNIEQRASDKKKIATVVAVTVLLVLGFIYAQKNGFWLNKEQRVIDANIEQALKRMDEVTKSVPPLTPADVAEAEKFMSDIRATETANQTKKK